MLRTIDKPFQDVAVHVANMRDAGGVLICLESGKMSVASPMEADNCKIDAIIGAENLAITFGGRSNRQTCSTYRERVKEFTSSHHLVSPVCPIGRVVDA